MDQNLRQAEPVRSALADGRELLYFFDGGKTPAEFVPPKDTRSLPARPASSDLRYDALAGEWISFAAHRQTRTHLPAASDCPPGWSTGTAGMVHRPPADHATAATGCR